MESPLFTAGTAPVHDARWRACLCAAGMRCLPVALALSAVLFIPFNSTDSVRAAAPSGASIPAGAEFMPGEVLVKIADTGAARQALPGLLSASERATASELPELGVLKIQVAPGDESRRATELGASPGVEYAEPNYIVRALEIPDDPYFGDQWGLTRINAPQVWDYFHGGPDVTIAIVDTGIDGAHEDLHDKVLVGYDYIADSPFAAGASYDDFGHGTHVAGICSAITDNLMGVAGVSWGALLMPVKVLDAAGNGTYEDVALGVRYAASHGAQVINLSLGGDSYSQTLKDAVDYAVGRGCVVVASNGRSGAYAPSYPAAYPNVIAVGSIDFYDQRSWFSNRGPELDVVAPGENIYSTFYGPDYYSLQGTSMAAPFVSGLGALLWSACPADDGAHVRTAIETTAVDLGGQGRDDFYGYGRIDAERAIHYYYDLSASPDRLLFLSDNQTPPGARDLVVTAVNRCGTFQNITWTAAISPTSATWLSIAPDAGVVTSSVPIEIQVQASTSGLAYGTYDAEILLTGETGTMTLEKSVGVRLSYTDALERQMLVPIYKQAP